MDYPWLGVIVAGVGLVLSAVLWFGAVVSVEAGQGQDARVCTSRIGFEVPCELGGVSLEYGTPLAPLVLVGSGLLVHVSVRAASGGGRRRRQRPRRTTD